jgi:hypothetical protein
MNWGPSYQPFLPRLRAVDAKNSITKLISEMKSPF